jgi:hypothetical protein
MRRLALACAALLAVACSGGEDALAPGAEPAPPAAAPAPAASEATPGALDAALPAAGEWHLAFANGVVSVDAFDAPRRPLLEALAQRAGFALEAAPGNWPPLTLRLEAQPLEIALPLLVGELEYRAEWIGGDGAHRLAKLVVGGPRDAAALVDGVALRPGEVSDSLERALKAFADEDASEALSEEDALALMASEDADARLRAVLALEGEGAGLAALTSAIERDPDPRVRAAATVGLEDSEEVIAIQALLGALDDPHPEVIIEAIDSLEFAADASIVPQLQPLLSHPDPRVRQAAANAIRLLGD